MQPIRRATITLKARTTSKVSSEVQTKLQRPLRPQQAGHSAGSPSFNSSSSRCYSCLRSLRNTEWRGDLGTSCRAIGGVGGGSGSGVGVPVGGRRRFLSRDTMKDAAAVLGIDDLNDPVSEDGEDKSSTGKGQREQRKTTLAEALVRVWVLRLKNHLPADGPFYAHLLRLCGEHSNWPQAKVFLQEASQGGDARLDTPAVYHQALHTALLCSTSNLPEVFMTAPSDDEVMELWDGMKASIARLPKVEAEGRKQAARLMSDGLDVILDILRRRCLFERVSACVDDVLRDPLQQGGVGVRKGKRYRYELSQMQADALREACYVKLARFANEGDAQKALELYEWMKKPYLRIEPNLPIYLVLVEALENHQGEDKVKLIYKGDKSLHAETTLEKEHLRVNNLERQGGGVETVFPVLLRNSERGSNSSSGGGGSGGGSGDGGGRSHKKGALNKSPADIALELLAEAVEQGARRAVPLVEEELYAAVMLCCMNHGAKEKALEVFDHLLMGTLERRREERERRREEEKEKQRAEGVEKTAERRRSRVVEEKESGRNRQLVNGEKKRSDSGKREEKWSEGGERSTDGERGGHDETMVGGEQSQWETVRKRRRRRVGVRLYNLALKVCAELDEEEWRSIRHYKRSNQVGQAVPVPERSGDVQDTKGWTDEYDGYAGLANDYSEASNRGDDGAAVAEGELRDDAGVGVGIPSTGTEEEKVVSTSTSTFITSTASPLVYGLLHIMNEEGIVKDSFTYMHLLKVLGRLQMVEAAVQMLKDMRQAGVAPDKWHFSAAATACSEGRRPDVAVLMLRDMQLHGLEPTTYNYTTTIRALCQSTNTSYGGRDEAVSLVQEMQARGIQPNQRTMNEFIVVAAKKGDPIMAIQLLRYMQHLAVTPDNFSFNIAIRACINAKDIGLAWALFNHMGDYQHPNGTATEHNSQQQASVVSEAAPLKDRSSVSGHPSSSELAVDDEADGDGSGVDDGDDEAEEAAREARRRHLELVIDLPTPSPSKDWRTYSIMVAGLAKLKQTGKAWDLMVEMDELGLKVEDGLEDFVRKCADTMWMKQVAGKVDRDEIWGTKGGRKRTPVSKYAHS